MARKHRFECSDGLYHLLNRGNYRSHIFGDEGARWAFEKVLFEACERFGWELNAFCLMSNHYHFCLATPKGNLSSGMQWLQGTFAARFNRYRKEVGRLFQGRFKSLVVEPGKHQLDLIDYIHLNPVRAGMMRADQLGSYRWTSLYHLPETRRRPPFFDVSWLAYGDSLADTASGWRRYKTLLARRATVDAEEAKRLERRLCRGWCIGEKAFRDALVVDLLQKDNAIRLEKEQLGELNRHLWGVALERSLEWLGVSQDEARRTRRSASWKLAIACKMKRETSVTNAWLAEKLYMGVPNAVSNNCIVYAKAAEQKCPYAEKLKNMKYEQ